MILVFALSIYSPLSESGTSTFRYKIITKENFPVEETLEQALNEIYRAENFDQLRAPNIAKRAGAAGAGYSNESLFPEKLKLSPAPNGYIIGTGNGAIWSMLELFPPGTVPKGIISLDYDPSVILGGKIIVELGKKGISGEEAIAYLYGSIIQESGGKSYHYTVDEFIAIAKEVAERGQNPKAKQIFIDTIEKGNFREDTNFMRQTHDLDYNMPLFERGEQSFEIKGRINTAGILYKHWGTISKLVREGRIAFLYTDMGNERTLTFIAFVTKFDMSCYNLFQ